MLIDQDNDVMYDAKPISYIFSYDDNANFDGGNDKNDSPKNNDDTTIIIAPPNEVICTLFHILIYL